MRKARAASIPFAQASADDGILPENGNGRTIRCDINGTLDEYHKIIIPFLMIAKKRGYNVILHSLSPLSNGITIKLMTIKYPEFKEFIESLKEPEFPIEQKDKNNMFDTFLLIDDESDCGVGYIPKKGQNFWKPSDGRIHTTMKAWSKSSTLPSVPAAHIVVGRSKNNSIQKHL